MTVSKERLDLIGVLTVWAQFTPDVNRESLTNVLRQLAMDEHMEKILTPEMQIAILGQTQQCNTGTNTAGGLQQ